MTAPSVSYKFNGTVSGDKVNVNFDDMVNYIRLRNNASAQWDSLDVAGDGSIDGDVTIGGDVSITGDAAITGDLTMTGEIHSGSLTPSAIGRFIAVEAITAHAHYAFIDQSTVTPSAAGTDGHATFSDDSAISGSNDMDHHHSYQAGGDFGGSGTLSEFTSFRSIPGASGGGTVTQYFHFYCQNPSSGATITTQYGLYMGAMTRGGTNWGVYQSGSTASLLPTLYGSEDSGGDLNLNSTTHATKGSIITDSEIIMPATDKLRWDGSASGNTYTAESSADTLVDTVGGTGVLTRTASKIYTVDYTDYSGTSTITGWSSLSTSIIDYFKIGKLVWVWFSFAGTSDTTTVSFTLPFANANEAHTLNTACRASDNGTDLTTPGLVRMTANSTTVNVYSDFSLAAWTGSGNKQCEGQFFYHTT